VRRSLKIQPTLKTASLALLLAAVTGGCAVIEYGGRRLRDLTDVVNLKTATSPSLFGLGAKLEATDFLGAGLGAGSDYDVREFVGRRIAAGNSGYLHAVIAGVDGPRAWRLDGDAYIGGVGLAGLRGTYPLMERWRFGAELWLPFAGAGLYLNAAEVVDFVGGILLFDPAEDDELPLGARYEDPEEATGEQSTANSQQ
jgi:hypothetical protein